MPARLITPPAALAVSLDAARDAARADGTDLDAEITQHVRAITEEAEHETGRAFIEQTWRVTLDAFPAQIMLPNPPLMSVESIKYYDAEGVQQTLAETEYEVNSASEPATVKPAYGKSWPSTAIRSDAVQVQYKCGYGADESSVPESVKGYILARVAEAYGQVPNERLPRLLDRVRVY